MIKVSEAAIPVCKYADKSLLWLDVYTKYMLLWTSTQNSYIH